MLLSDCQDPSTARNQHVSRLSRLHVRSPAIMNPRQRPTRDLWRSLRGAPVGVKGKMAENGAPGKWSEVFAGVGGG